MYNEINNQGVIDLNQFKPAYFQLKSILVSSVAVIGLASVAQAQAANSGHGAALGVGAARNVQVNNVQIINSDTEYAIEISTSQGVKISGATITDTKTNESGIFIYDSSGVQVENVKVRGGQLGVVLEIEGSGSVNVKNLSFEKGSARYGIIVTGDSAIFPDYNRSIILDNISINGAKTGASIRNDAGRDLELTLKDIVVQNALTAFELYNGIVFIDLGGIRSISSRDVCDDTISKNNGIRVHVGGGRCICYL